MSGPTALDLIRAAGPRSPLRDAFLGWQCRLRQRAMRTGEGRPDEGATPALTLPGAAEPMGHVITVLNRAPAHAMTPELMHMAKRTADPAERRRKAIEFFAATYFQRPRQFTDVLSATFPPGSPGAARIREAGYARLDFRAFAQGWRLDCRVWRLAERHPLHAATWWHNHLFNPALAPDAVILAFEPDWSASSADPSPV